LCGFCLSNSIKLRHNPGGNRGVFTEALRFAFKNAEFVGLRREC
jgi:hypothetical protein